jgi:uncharacterized protein involved in exopolysaccharide biosynthesis
MSEETIPSESGEQARSSGDEDDIDLLALAIIMAKQKKLIVGLPLLVALVTAMVAMVLPDIYTATTKILPPQQTPSASSVIVSQIGNLAAGVGGGVAALKNPNDLYIGMLKSRTVADNLIQRFDLKKRYDTRYMEQARKKLEAVTTISSGRDSIITIQTDDEDPKFAAELANAYVEELFNLTKVLAVTETSQRRLFFERQLAQAKESLARFETSAKQALDHGGVMKVDEQGRSLVETAARLRAQITVKEVQIGAMRTFASDRNPELILAQQELEVLKREVAKAEGTALRNPIADSKTGRGMDNLALLRDLKYHEGVYEMLARQYELAKIDEAKDASVIQVMDTALQPESKSKPRRGLIVLLSGLLALFAGIVCAFIREAVINARSNPATSQRFQVLRHYLVWHW